MIENGYYPGRWIRREAKNPIAASAFLGIFAMLALGCGDSNVATPTAPTTGALEIKVSTVSADADIDPDGYFLVIDEGAAVAVDVNAALTIGALQTGRHQARLEGLTEKCLVTGFNPRAVYVGTETAPSLPVFFVVSCAEINVGGGGEWD